jgi:hypothetical protein
MRWILDACTLIYLVKAGLFDRFIQLTELDVVIDSSVYEETVIQGKDHNYSDAFLIEDALAKHNIASISLDVKPYLEKFKDKGETSCYILASSDGTCVTTDKKACAKFKGFGISALKLDEYFYQAFESGSITKINFLDILRQLDNVNAIDAKMMIFYQDLADQVHQLTVDDDD